MKTDPYREREEREQAHAAAPTDPEIASDLAMLYLEHEEDTRAEQVLEPALRVHPHHPRANLHMAMALAKTAPPRARDHARKALQDADPERRQQAEVLLRILAGET